MNDLLRNPGLSVVSIEIFSLLDITDLQTSILVCKLWKDFILSYPKVMSNALKNQLKRVELSNNFGIRGEQAFQEWQVIIQEIKESTNFTDIVLMSKLLDFEELSQFHIFNGRPLKFACSYG